MERMPAAIGELAGDIGWPDPAEDGSVTLDPDTHRRVQALIAYLTNYVTTQFERCVVNGAETEG